MPDDGRRLTSWVENHLRGTVVSLEREDRWRPSWRAELARGSEIISLHLRGDRGHSFSYPLGYEAAILRVLESSGVPVPHVYGMCDEPEAIVMQHVPGTRQLTGIGDDAARQAIVDEYVDILASIHAIDVARFEAAGLRNPTDPVDIQDNFHRDRMSVYREQLKSRPEPFVEFVLGWMARNVPRHRSRRSFVTFDAGQFLVEDGHISALYDFEISHINDPLADLGGLRVRNVFEPLGDLGYLFRRYERATGEELDRAVINYHSIALALAANEGIAKLLTQSIPDAITYLTWEVSGSLIALSAMADTLGVALDPVAARVEPTAKASRRTPAVRSMLTAVQSLSVTPDGRYAQERAADLARYVERVEAYGPALDAADMEDVATVLGRTPRDGEDVELALEQHVQRAGPDEDVALLQLFHRRAERQRMLLPDFDPGTAAAGDIGPHLDRCYLPALADVLEGATAVEGAA